MLIDSETALDALAKGYSRVADVAQIVTVFWELVSRHQIQVFLDRVPTDSNISDGVSRSDIRGAKDLGWKLIDPDIEEFVGTNADIRKIMGVHPGAVGQSRTRTPHETNEKTPGERATGRKRPRTDGPRTATADQTR